MTAASSTPTKGGQQLLVAAQHKAVSRVAAECFFPICIYILYILYVYIVFRSGRRLSMPSPGTRNSDRGRGNGVILIIIYRCRCSRSVDRFSWAKLSAGRKHEHRSLLRVRENFSENVAYCLQKKKKYNKFTFISVRVIIYVFYCKNNGFRVSICCINR